MSHEFSFCDGTGSVEVKDRIKPFSECYQEELRWKQKEIGWQV